MFGSETLKYLNPSMSAGCIMKIIRPVISEVLKNVHY